MPIQVTKPDGTIGYIRTDNNDFISLDDYTADIQVYGFHPEPF